MKRIAVIFLALLLLLTGCGSAGGPEETETSMDTEAPAVEASQTEAAEAGWEWPVYEVEQTVVYDANGVVLTIDAIHQNEEDPSRVYFTYTVTNNSGYEIQLDVSQVVINGYSGVFNAFSARAEAGETVTKDSKATVKVPTGSEGLVMSFRGGQITNCDQYSIMDDDISFDICTKGADPEAEYTYPTGEVVVHQDGVRIEYLGRIGDESGLSMSFLIFNEREDDLSMVVMDPTAINGIDVTEAESWVFWQYYTPDIFSHSGYILILELSRNFLQEFPEIQRLESMTVEVTARAWDRGSYDLYTLTGIEISD